MKKIIVSSIVSIMLTSPVVLFAQQGKGFTLKGKIGSSNSPLKMYLAGSLDPKSIIDSSALNNGVFEFKGKLDMAKQVVLVAAPNSASLMIKRGSRSPMPDSKYFYLDAGTTEVNSKDFLKNAVVSGASVKINNDNHELQEALKPIWDMNSAIGNLDNKTSEEVKKTDAFQKEYNAKIAAADKSEKEVLNKFIKAHPQSAISLKALSQYASKDPVVVNEVKALYNTLSAGIRNSSSGKSYAASISKMEKTGIGSIAPDFVENDVNGKPVHLSDFKGKYVLLDFWASWCGPCRAENPNVVKAYHKYKDKNFTVLGVSLDKTKELWLQAIEKDNLPWTQVCDFKDFNNVAARLYEVHAIPTNFLIDPQGKIIGKNLRGVELEEALAKFVNNKTSTSQDANKFVIKGKVAEKYDAPLNIYLTDANTGKAKDSCVLNKGSFEFKGQLDEPFEATLTIQNTQGAKHLWVVAGVTSVIGQDLIYKAAITGSQLNDDQAKYDAMLKDVAAKEALAQDTMVMNYNKDPKAANKKYDEDMRNLLPERMRITTQFIKEHPDSYLSLIAVSSFLSNNPDIAVIGPLFATLSDSLKATPKGKETAAIVNQLKAVGVGTQAPVFVQNDVNGKPVSLADFKGKYVLIDFWASWCIPCRAENPDVVKAYHKFKDKNFTILGVSLDGENSKQAWIDAIKKDQLTWTQISDLKEWKNNAAALYGVRSIPANFLIDPSGKIIAKNLHGIELDKKLAEIL